VSQASTQAFVSVQDVRNAAAMESGGAGSDETDIGSMDIDVERLYRRIYGYLSKSSRDAIKIYGEARFIKDMGALREGTEIEVCARSDNVSPKLFEEAVPLQTLTELHTRTLHMLAKEDYNYGSSGSRVGHFRG
jgi:hypothetical protein